MAGRIQRQPLLQVGPVQGSLAGQPANMPELDHLHIPFQPAAQPRVEAGFLGQQRGTASGDDQHLFPLGLGHWGEEPGQGGGTALRGSW